MKRKKTPFETTLTPPQQKRKLQTVSDALTTTSVDTAGIITSYLEIKDVIQLSNTNHQAHALFTKPATLGQKLLEAVAHGQIKIAEELINFNPEILLYAGTITDYSGRVHVKRTAYQLALGAYDGNVTNRSGDLVQEGMIEMIEKSFLKLAGKTVPEINAIIRRQYEGQFPRGYEKHEDECVAADLNALQTVVSAISKASLKTCELTLTLEEKIWQTLCKAKSAKTRLLRKLTQSVLKANTENFAVAFEVLTIFLITHHFVSGTDDLTLLKSLYQFRNQLEPKHAYTTGKHFNHQVLASAIQLASEHYERFGRVRGPKYTLFWQKIFGLVQRLLPASEAQIVAQGARRILEMGDKSLRSLKFSFGGGQYFPLNSGSALEIGYNCACPTQLLDYPCQDPAGLGGGLARQGWRMRAFNTLCEMKASIPVLKQYPVPAYIPCITS